MNRPRRVAPVLDAMNRVSTVYNMCAVGGVGWTEWITKAPQRGCCGAESACCGMSKDNGGGTYCILSAVCVEQFVCYSRRTSPSTSATP